MEPPRLLSDDLQLSLSLQRLPRLVAIIVASDLFHSPAPQLAPMAEMTTSVLHLFEAAWPRLPDDVARTRSRMQISASVATFAGVAVEFAFK